MAELTSSTRDAARRLGVSDTPMHKAERTGRIAREPDGQWDITKTRARLLETVDPQRSLASSRSRRMGANAAPADDVTEGSALPPLMGQAYLRKERRCLAERGAQRHCPMKKSHAHLDSFEVAPSRDRPRSGHVKPAIHLDHLSGDEARHLRGCQEKIGPNAFLNGADPPHGRELD